VPNESKKDNSNIMFAIIAIGDSLTAGYQSAGYDCTVEFTPYTSFLEERLSENEGIRKKKVLVQIHNRGISGELTHQMLARFNADVLMPQPNLAIVLGGSNDLGWGISPSEVFSNLVKMYDLAEKNRIATIACSIPSILGFDSLVPPRRELNGMIRKYCIKKGKAFADLFKATAHPTTKRLLEGYSSDGLHLSTDGYRKMADTIFDEALRDILDGFVSEST
jgi:lysophospholipase L1-like esterase